MGLQIRREVLEEALVVPEVRVGLVELVELVVELVVLVVQVVEVVGVEVACCACSRSCTIVVGSAPLGNHVASSRIST
jgi:hypothetical protein